MMRLFRCEWQKTRRCYVILTALALTALTLAAGLRGNVSEDAIRLGWGMMLYQMPLINAVFLPLTAALIASRLCGVEQKDGMLRKLCCLTERGRLFDVKLACGLILMTACVLITWGVTVAFGYAKGFEGEWPARLYGYYLLFTLVPTLAIYIFQHTLSLCVKNQALPFFIGIGGETVGLFLMFIPKLTFLKKSLLWAYYGVLSFMGLFDWSKETRYEFARFEVMGIDWAAFAGLTAGCFVLYLAGREWFKRKEIQ